MSAQKVNAVDHRVDGCAHRVLVHSHTPQAGNLQLGVSEQFRQALPKAKSPNRLTIVQALGVLRDEPSIKSLKEATQDKDRETRLLGHFAHRIRRGPFPPPRDPVWTRHQACNLVWRGNQRLE